MVNYLIMVYSYLIIGICIIFLNIEIDDRIWRTYLTFVIFFVFKWIFNYRKCTISYIEYRLRDSKRDDCILYNFLENMVNLRYNKNLYKIYFLCIVILYDFFIIKKNSLHFP